MLHATSARADFEPLYLEKWKERPQSGTITINVLFGEHGMLPVTVPLNDTVSSALTHITKQLATARLQQSQVITTGNDGRAVGDCQAGPELFQFLSSCDLQKWQPQLQALGAETVLHLQALQDADLISLGMPLLQRRTLLRALGVGGPPGREAVVDSLEVGADDLVRVGSAVCTDHAGAAATVVWEFKSAQQSWTPYDESAQAALEAAHASDQASVALSHGQWSYIVDLGAMRQTNTETAKVRDVRRQVL